MTGRIVLCGGPAPGRCFGQDGAVSVLDARGRLTLRTTHARFSFRLPAARYTLEARTGGTRAKRKVLVRAGETTHVRIVIPIP